MLNIVICYADRAQVQIQRERLSKEDTIFIVCAIVQTETTNYVSWLQ